MNLYTFAISPGCGQPHFSFDVCAEDDNDAVRRAREMLLENEEQGGIHVDLDFGLANGKLCIPESAINKDTIVAVRKQTQPF